MVTASVVHAFGGGVTVAWVVERIHEWDAMLSAHLIEARRSRRRPDATPVNAVVH